MKYKRILHETNSLKEDWEWKQKELLGRGHYSKTSSAMRRIEGWKNVPVVQTEERVNFSDN